MFDNQVVVVGLFLHVRSTYTSLGMCCVSVFFLSVLDVGSFVFIFMYLSICCYSNVFADFLVLVVDTCITLDSAKVC